MKPTYLFTVIGILLILIAVLGAAYVFIPRTTHSTPDAIALAECLRGKGATMYGAEWCPHCQNEKRAFGEEAFARIPYVECPIERAVCEAKGIQGFPTWIFANGLVIEGEQGLTGLAAKSGCPFGNTQLPGTVQ